MFKNRKMYFLKRIIFLLILMFNNQVNCQNRLNYSKPFFDTIYIEEKDLVIQNNHKKSIYKDLIAEGISVSTSVKIFKNNIFYLIYEYNASSTKMQYIYKFCSTENVSLIYKEVVYLNKSKIEGFRLYPKGYKLKDLSLDKMEHIGEELVSSDKGKTPIYFDKEQIAHIEYDNYGIDHFINIEDYFENDLIKKFNIINVEKLNNLAFNLYNYSAFDDSIFLFKKILDKYPSRTVAYLNLADSYWAIGNQELAKEKYKKYLTLMKSQKKDLKKIPNYVWERVK